MTTTTKLSKDNRLLQGIASGNTLVINEIYTKYFDSVVTYLSRNKGGVEDAKDLFQDAIMVIYQKTKTENFQLNYSLHTYLFAICKNLWLKKLRKKQDFGVPLSPEMEPIDDWDIEQVLINRLKDKLYREKFVELGETCQKIISLYLAGKSMQEIATALDFNSIGYAKKSKYKCKNKLVNLIQTNPVFQELKEN